MIVRTVGWAGRGPVAQPRRPGRTSLAHDRPGQADQQLQREDPAGLTAPGSPAGQSPRDGLEAHPPVHPAVAPARSGSATRSARTGAPTRPAYHVDRPGLRVGPACRRPARHRACGRSAGTESPGRRVRRLRVQPVRPGAVRICRSRSRRAPRRGRSTLLITVLTAVGGHSGDQRLESCAGDVPPNSPPAVHLHERGEPEPLAPQEKTKKTWLQVGADRPASDDLERRNADDGRCHGVRREAAHHRAPDSEWLQQRCHKQNSLLTDEDRRGARGGRAGAGLPTYGSLTRTCPPGPIRGFRVCGLQNPLDRQACALEKSCR